MRRARIFRSEVVPQGPTVTHIGVSMRGKKIRSGLVVALTAAAAMVVFPIAVAQAGSTSPQASSVKTGGPAKTTVVEARYSSTLTIVRNGKTTNTISTPVVVSVNQPPVTDGQGPGGATIYCNRLYKFSDGDGTYSIQHGCGATSSPWGYKISSTVCAIVASTVHEAGMSWTRNGVAQGTQAFHDVPCDYQFHGTYNPDRDYDHIAYADVFTFLVKGGHGTLQIHGDFTTVGSTCSPTSC